MANLGNFASLFESPSSSAGNRQAVRLEAGQQVEGTVLALSGGLVILDIGSSADATLDLNEVTDRTLKVGDRLKATVKSPRIDAPVLTLSLGRGGTAVSGAALQIAFESGTPVNGTVKESNKGGFTVEIAGARAFCPMSQIDINFVNDAEAFVGQTFDFLITEIREAGRNVVVSRRRILEDERRDAEEKLAGSLAPGAIIEGIVKSTVRHGAVIDLGGAEGFVPMSELARARVENAEDVVTIGEKVRVQVLTVERGERGLSIRLSLRALETSSNEEKKAAPARDEILNGKVVKHTGGGLIVSTSKGEGLVPTRELSLAPGADHRRTYPVDTELRVVVVSRDPSNGRLRFSVDKVAQVEERNNFRDFSKDSSEDPTAGMGSLGDLMAKKFPQLSEAAAKAKAQVRAESQQKAQVKPSPEPLPPQGMKVKAAPAEQPSKENLSPAADRDGIKRRKK
jgi:small subunit ribosomal protein S1